MTIAEIESIYILYGADAFNERYVWVLGVGSGYEQASERPFLVLHNFHPLTTLKSV